MTALCISGCSESRPADAEKRPPADSEGRLPCFAKASQGGIKTKYENRLPAAAKGFGGLNDLGEGKIVSARLISSRTLSSKIRFENGGKAVFKPFLKYDKRASREVAVFRLARALGIESVPISTIRKVRLHLLVAHIKRKNSLEAEMLNKKAAVDDKGYVQGAVIQWIDGLDPDGYKSQGGKAALEKMVSPSRPLSDKESSLALAVSNMVVLDYLTGNWDRFSGGNIYLDKDGRLVLLDHNGTFAPWSDKQKKRMEKLLAGTERFSEGLIDRVKELDEEKVERVLDEEPWHKEHRLITKKEVALLLERRDKIVAHVHALLERSGAEAVLPFP